MRWTLLVVGLALALGFSTLATTARVGGGEPPPTPVAIAHAAESPRVVAVFIDSLARSVASDPRRMPGLARLAAEGAAFDVEPCRDQLTYLCLRAALTGHDESSLLAVADNFRPSHEGPPDNLLSALATQRRRSVVIGTEDFHPYRRYLRFERRLSKRDETEHRVLAELDASSAERADLTLISLGSGDMAAHAHGTASPEYAAAFARLDRVVAAVAAALDPDVHLLVFGDHGHDAEGRHLPGTASRTWALYRGPAFRAGFEGQLSLTDHRALLGVLLGVPTEPSYAGPVLSSVLSPDWVERYFPRGLPRLSASTASLRRGLIGPWQAAAFVALVGVGLWVLAAGAGGARYRWGLAVAVALAAAVGFHFDALRSVVHDHGGEPERGAWLLIPLSLAASASWRKPRPLLALATGSVLVCLLLLPPTAYYYGARRAIVVGGVIALVAVTLERLRCAGGERFRPCLALGFVAATLVSFYPVRQLGPETAGAAAWALDSFIYTQVAWLPLLASKLVLYAIWIWPRATSHPLDSALGGAVLALCALAQLSGVELPRAGYAVVLVALVLGLVASRQRAAGCLVAGALLLLVHLFSGDRPRLAALEMLLAASAAAAWAWPRLGLSARGGALATGLSAAVASYLMLWPTVGFHLVGIDFSYVFRWIPAEDYERAWLVIALAAVAKLALPLTLVIVLGRPRRHGALAVRALLGTLSTKVALLCVMVVAHAATTDMRSQQALAMLAELCLVMFVTGVAAGAARLWVVAGSARKLASASPPAPGDYPVVKHEY